MVIFVKFGGKTVRLVMMSDTELEDELLDLWEEAELVSDTDAEDEEEAELVSDTDAEDGEEGQLVSDTDDEDWELSEDDMDVVGMVICIWLVLVLGVFAWYISVHML